MAVARYRMRGWLLKYQFTLICEVRMETCDQKCANSMSDCKTIIRICSISTACFYRPDVSVEGS
jgi:hypothetical protein